ncbi:unnamed protein product [Durusdinium trenchii]|uniref:Uncharacterized protein n=2 Tax=Durusdinium trenchii TaxID=1381693 RepID=A0ABP0NL86_9DINO
MRLRRLVETKSSGKCHVPPEVVADYKSGGELREWLEIALLESLKKIGTSRQCFNPMKADFKLRCKIVKERMLQKEKEVKGKWWTKEKMVKSGEYSPQSIQSICDYCSRFPQALTRAWKYNSSVTEYFLEDETTTVLRMSERVTETQEQEKDCVCVCVGGGQDRCKGVVSCNLAKSAHVQSHMRNVSPGCRWPS